MNSSISTIFFTLSLSLIYKNKKPVKLIAQIAVFRNLKINLSNLSNQFTSLCFSI